MANWQPISGKSWKDGRSRSRGHAVALKAGIEAEAKNGGAMAERRHGNRFSTILVHSVPHGDQA